MFKVLVLQTLYTLSDEQTEYQIRDRSPSCASSVWPSTTGCRMPRDLAVPPAVDPDGRDPALFARFDAALRDAGYLAMGGQVVDATM